MKYNLLKGRIITCFGTLTAFAFAVKTTPQNVYAKLHGKSLFNTRDIIKWCMLLDIQPQDVSMYFIPEFFADK